MWISRERTSAKRWIEDNKDIDAMYKDCKI